MTLAVFDIDGTLVDGSTERIFAAYLLRRGRIGPRQAFAYGAFALRHLPACGASVLQKNKAYLSGLDVAEIEALAERCVAERIEARLFAPAVDRLRWHRERGDEVLLLSGTLECIAQPLARVLGVDEVCATRLARRDHRWAARPAERHPYGRVKANLLRQLARAHGADPLDSFAYANSAHDLALLAAVGTPVAVLPDRGLLEAAVERGWEVIVDGRGPIAASAAAAFRA